MVFLEPTEAGVRHVFLTAPRRGHRLEIETAANDDIGRRIERRGLPYEWEELAISNALARRSERVIDIGANVGNHALYWAAHSDTDVVSFEPAGLALEMLIRNIERNQLSSRITVHRVALGEVGGRGRLHVASGNLGASHIELIQASGFRDENEVEIARLDDYVLRGVGLIKIDVEGMEIDVIRGAKETLAREGPAVWVELLTGEASRLVRLELEAVGYRQRPIMLSDTNALYLRKRSQALAIARSPTALRLLARRATGRRSRSLRACSRRWGLERSRV